MYFIKSNLAYIISCGSCLPDTVYLPFISGVYGGEFRLSEWSSKQLRDVTTILLQPPEALLDGKLPADISINEVKQFWPARIQRAISAIRVEKLMVGTIDYLRFYLPALLLSINAPLLLHQHRFNENFSEMRKIAKQHFHERFPECFQYHFSTRFPSGSW